ncbi:MAG: hypothetical protein ABIG71_01765 [Candidatus Uhrbacteria bacterium]
MKPLPQRFDRIMQRANSVVQYAAQRRKQDDKQVDSITDSGEWFTPLGVTWIALSLVVLVGSGIFSTVDPNISFGWFGCTTVVSSIVSILTTWHITVRRGFRLQYAQKEALGRELSLQREADKLYQRALLIEKALADYKLHCTRYREWRTQVEDELVDDDPESADRYFDTIVRWQDVLDQAIDNFETVRERVEREKAFVSQHGAERAADNDGLARLTTELNAEVELPQLPHELIDPIRALEDEQRLSKVAQELQQLTQITSRS